MAYTIPQLVESVLLELTIIAAGETPDAETADTQEIGEERFDPQAQRGLVHADRAARFGGELDPPKHEWEYRGYRVCDGLDPEGNIVQFREQM